jgi:hypothetical protein
MTNRMNFRGNHKESDNKKVEYHERISPDAEILEITKVAVERNDGRYDERDPTGCGTFWRSGVEKRKKGMMKSEMKKMEQKGQKTKGGRSIKKNEKGDDEERQEDEEERKESEECLLQHLWCGNFSPQFTCTETYTRTLGLSCMELLENAV